MKKLTKQLKRNTKALDRLSVRYSETQNSYFYTNFKSGQEREVELKWVLQIRKRVLRMRFRILENINLEILKEMQYTSTQSRELNLKVA